MREGGIPLSTISAELLSLETVPEQLDYIRENFTMLLQHQNFITCLSKLNKNMEEEKAVMQLVVGTEQRQVLVLDPSGMVVKKQVTLKAGVPSFIQCQGLFDVEYKIFVACRDGQVVVIRNGEVTDQVFRIEGRPLGMLLFEK